MIIKNIAPFILLLIHCNSIVAEECKYNIKKNDRGYTLIKDCLKTGQPDLLKNTLIKVDPYTVLKNFDSLGTNEIEDDELYGSSIFNKEEDEVQVDPIKVVVVPSSNLDLDKTGDLRTFTNDLNFKESSFDSLSTSDINHKLDVGVLDLDSNVVHVEGSKNQEFKVNPLAIEDKKNESWYSRLSDRISSRITNKKRFDLAVGYFQVNAVDLRTSGILKVQGGSNRLDYNYIANIDKWFTEFTAKLDFIMLNGSTSFKTLNTKELLIGGKIKTGHISGEDKFGGSISKIEIPVLGRFGRDPKKDIVLTSIASPGVSAFYEHSFETLFDSKFELTYLFGGENEHFKMNRGTNINLEISKVFLKDLKKTVTGAILFEGTSYNTEGVDNKDSRVMLKIGLEW
jgi:hypothetical protein